MRRLLSPPLWLLVLMAFALVAALATPAMSVPLTPTGTFLDDDGSVHEADIEAIAEAAVTRGCNPPANDAYCPKLPVTRAQAASFLARSLVLDGPLPVDPPDAFVDDDGNVHEDDIDAIAALGVLRGCDPPDNTEVCPDDPLTRGQMAAMLTRAFGYVDDDPGTDRFVDDAGSIFESDIEALAAAAVTRGCNPPDNDEYCPNDHVLRGQMASFLARALGLPPLFTPTVESAEFVKPFFTTPSADGDPYLTPVARYVASGTATPDTAVEWLLEGPTPGELVQSPAFSSAVPIGTTLNGVSVAGGVATVDLSEEFDDGGGTLSMMTRLGQLTLTLVDFDDIDLVRLELDGVPISTFSGEGIEIGDGMDEQMFFDAGLVPEHFNTAPAWWQYTASPLEVSGWSRAFEATFEYAVYDSEGLPVAEGTVTGGSGGLEWLPFTFEITYSVDHRQLGSLELFSFDIENGGRQFIFETAIWLEP